nr:1-phosphatidylinositol-5-phosphate 4-kinase [Halisarca dujardinii]
MAAFEALEGQPSPHTSTPPSVEVTELVRHVEETTLLLPEDFKAYSKIRIENQHYNKEYLPGHFKVKEYCPLVFRDLRKRFCVDDIEYKDSLTRSSPLCMDSPGRSGAKFYSSYDKRFIIKNLSSEEVSLMLQILQAYHAHVVTTEGQTLLPEYLSMYRLTVADKETYLIVTRNVLASKLPTHVKYDLKGSTIARSASIKERAKSSPTFKDVDFTQECGRIRVDPTTRKEFLDKVEQDVEFLQTQHLMDYSLLVGIHFCKLYPRGKEDDDEEDENEADNEGDGSEEERRINGRIEEEDENSTDNNADVSSEGRESSTPTSPGGKTDDQTTKTPPGSPAPPTITAATPTVDTSAPKQGSQQQQPPQQQETLSSDQNVKGAVCLPPALPALVVGQKAVEVAKTEGKWPVVDLMVDKYALLSSNEVDPTIYFMAIIDVLTLYNAKKKAAHAAKTVKHGHGAEISTVRPDQYSRRFIEFLSKSIP